MMIPTLVRCHLLNIVLAFTTLTHAKTISYFSGQDNIEHHLIERIHNASQRIYAAVYMLTSTPVANALIAAKQRGLDIQVVSDVSCVTSRYGKIDHLKKAGIDVFVFKHTASNSYDEALMHHKFAIIDRAVWTGSYNWTRSANRRNKENVLITDEDEMVTNYCAQFNELKTCCAQSPQPRKKNDTTSTRYITRRLMSFLQKLKRKLFDRDA